MDALGSVRQVVDQTGSIVFARWYDPFGQIIKQNGGGDALYGYLGAQFDRISGLLYINDRYYDPVTGRFLTPGDNGQNSPYVPFAGAALAPILILALLGRRKKSKIWTGWLVIAMMASVGVVLVACDGQSAPTPTIPSPPTWPRSNPEKVVAKAKEYVGQKLWELHDESGDFYQYFVQGREKRNIDFMNCWEMYLYARYETGDIDKDWIKNFYIVAPQMDPAGKMNVTAGIWKQLGADTARPYSLEQPPQIGDLVFFSRPNLPYTDHVALSEGGVKVISLWYGPDVNATVQETTIEAIKKFIMEEFAVNEVIVTIGKLP